MKIPWGEKAVNLVDPWDILARDSRIVTIFSAIISSQSLVDINSGQSHPLLAENIFAELIMLGQQNGDPIKIAINSSGGDIVAGLSMVYAMEHLKKKGIEVWTLNLSNANSMASLLLMLGTKGRRYALENSVTVTHFGTRQSGGRPSDKAFADAYQQHIDDLILDLLSEHTTIPRFFAPEHFGEENVPDKKKIDSDPKTRRLLIRKFLENDRYLKPEKALGAGLIDFVLKPGDPITDQFFAPTRKNMPDQGGRT